MTSNAAADENEESRPAVRTFRFIYAGIINELPPGATARVWLPLATDNFAQTIHEVKIDLPGEYCKTRERRFGNSLLYFEAEADQAGEVPFRVEYLVERRELTRRHSEPAPAEQRELFLTDSRFVPRRAGLLERLLPQRTGEEESQELAKLLYNVVGDRLRYDKPPGGLWGRGDAVWACGAGYGNCTDFHSLFLAAGYEAGVPGRFEIGFPLPANEKSGEIPGYHCWAFFASDGRWLPVDISEADKNPEQKDYYFGNLTADRVTFSVGRDLGLTPPQETGPVNFLVYPHVEVNGKQHTSFVKKFRFEDAP